MPTLYREFDTQAALDAQYNPSAGLPPGVNPALPYVEAAQQARSTLRHTLDVPFGPTLHETLDIFPADTPNAPVFVFIHGGYWRAFSSKEFSGVALGLQPLGITTVVVNYALCPWVSIDEITRQCRAAVAWTLRNIQRYGGDPTRVAVGGHSAGGHLSAMCLLTDWARDYGLPRDPLKAGLLFSGLFDIAPLRYTYLQPMIQLDDGVVRRQSPPAPCAPQQHPDLDHLGRQGKHRVRAPVHRLPRRLDGRRQPRRAVRHGGCGPLRGDPSAVRPAKRPLPVAAAATGSLTRR